MKPALGLDLSVFLRGNSLKMSGEYMEKKLSVAMFGQKRLTREGGIEIVVKELSTRMAQQGYQVTCYNRSVHHVSCSKYDAEEMVYDGVIQKFVPTIEKKGDGDIIGSTKKNHDK